MNWGFIIVISLSIMCLFGTVPNIRAVHEILGNTLAEPVTHIHPVTSLSLGFRFFFRTFKIWVGLFNFIPHNNKIGLKGPI